MKQFKFKKLKIFFKAFLLWEVFLYFFKKGTQSTFTKGVYDFHIDSQSSVLDLGSQWCGLWNILIVETNSKIQLPLRQSHLLGSNSHGFSKNTIVFHHFSKSLKPVLVDLRCGYFWVVFSENRKHDFSVLRRGQASKLLKKHVCFWKFLPKIAKWLK